MADEGYRGCAPLVGRASRGVLDANTTRASSATFFRRRPTRLAVSWMGSVSADEVCRDRWNGGGRIVLVCVCVFAMTSPGVSAADVGDVALSGSSD